MPVMNIWAEGVIINLDMQEGLEKFAGPGHWNDPDMLQVGNGGLTDSENRAHFALWCMLSAPLFAGNDLTNMTESTRKLLTNTELIAINQDALGKQGFKIKDYGEREVFYKPLQNNELAICIFNRFNHPVTVEMDWNTFQVTTTREGKVMQLPLKIDLNDIQLDRIYSVRDVFAKKGNRNNFTGFKTGNSKSRCGSFQAKIEVISFHHSRNRCESNESRFLQYLKL